jgi:integrase
VPVRPRLGAPFHAASSTYLVWEPHFFCSECCTLVAQNHQRNYTNFSFAAQKFSKDATAMPQKIDSTVHILEGSATLFKRPTSPIWHVRYKAHGKWERMTTKCEKLSDAKKAGADIVMNAMFREKNNLPIVSKRFKAVAKLAIARMNDMQAAKQGKATFKTYIQSLNKYFIPLIGNHNIDKIDNAVLAKFDRERLEMMGKIPSASVLNNHNSAINRVFDEAIERGYMTKFQIPLLRNQGVKTQRRPDFTLEDYTAIYKGMRKWVKEARKGNETTLRAVLREYVLVLANTGIRAGTEAMNLKWKNLFYFEEKGVRYLALNVNGKTGHREVIARQNALHYLDRLRKLNSEWQDGTFEEFIAKKVDAYVFRVKGKDMTTTFGRMFARFLQNNELQYDARTGKERTLYSLRHYYATMALAYDRMTIYTLSKHLGTSVKTVSYTHLRAHETG